MATREMRLQGGAVRTALLAMASLFLLALLGIDGPSGSAVVTAMPDVSHAERAADSRDSGRDGGRDGGRGCHEGENRAPRGALPAPERTSSPTFEATPAPYETRDEAGELPGAAPPDATSVDLYRTQVIRT
ncbi:hypothetical protein [Streptomyces sp. NPDC051218]|uniref:hypothetical protein n=1 Tax=Streptomyces sp. NPDC051218 TaxID=3365645 RepID=UPI0037AA0C56